MTDSDNGSKARFEALVDDNLKRIYSDLVQEELPDRFKNLLDQLREQDAAAGSKK